MKRSLLVFAALACCSLTFADNAMAIKAAIESNYKAITKAFQKQDSKGILALMTDDYKATAQNGQVVTKAQLGPALDQQVKLFQSCTWNRKITSFNLKGNTAVVATNSTFDGTTIVGADGASHKIKQVESATDTWVKSRNGYKLQKSVVQKTAITVDGKPIGG